MNNKKIAIILGSNIHWAPYYYKYEKLLIENNIDFDLIIWNRENIIEDCKASKIIEYKIKDKSDNKNPFKIFKFISFTGFIKKVIKKEKYTNLIFLGTHGCAPVFLAHYLKKNFNKLYWLDIRDYQYEWFRPFYILEKIAIENSYLTTISSKGYEKFLPKNYKYYYMHNIDPNMDDFVKKYKKELNNNSPIRISFIGNVRYIDENIKILNIFGNDRRFLLQYFGSGSEKIKNYCEETNIKNIVVSGRFKSSETLGFYEKTDIINNVYGNDKIGLTTALSNKLYYAVCFKLPILVCKNTYMEELTTKYDFGFVFDDKKNYPDELYKQYNNFIESKNKKIDKLWEEITKDEKEVVSKLKSFIK